MKSTEVYRLLRARLAPTCKALGFRRAEGGMLGWSRSAGEAAHMTFWCQCSQDGWDVYAGSRFTVEFQRSDDPRPGTGRPRVRFGALLAADERETIRRIQNQVIAALPPPPRDHPLLAEPSLRAYYAARFVGVAAPYAATDDIWLRYHAPADVERWAELLTDRMPHLVRAFETTSDAAAV